MGIQRCDLETAEHYINDIFEMLELRGNNQKLFNEMIVLLTRYSKETIKENWKTVVFNCELPNGQMAGKLPRLEFIENTFRNHTVTQHVKQHNQIKKREKFIPGVMPKLYTLGVELHNKEITRDQFNKKFEEIMSNV